MNEHSSGYTWVAVLFCFLFCGCARETPVFQPLTQTEADSARGRLDTFFDSHSCGSLDCDVLLEWQILGNRQKMPGLLQLQAPASARYTVIDPLGRPVFIVVADDSIFRAVVIPEAKGYVGEYTSSFWRRYVPAEVKGDDLYRWVSGGLRKEGMHITGMGKEVPGVGAWFEIKYDGTYAHQILVNAKSGIITRHLLVGDDGDVLFDVEYSNYNQTGKCNWPGTVIVNGTSLAGGTVTLTFSRVNRVSQLPDETFELIFPPGFSVESLK